MHKPVICNLFLKYAYSSTSDSVHDVGMVEIMSSVHEHCICKQITLPLSSSGDATSFPHRSAVAICCDGAAFSRFVGGFVGLELQSSPDVSNGGMLLGNPNTNPNIIIP